MTPVFTTPAHLTAQLLTVTEGAYLSHANLQVTRFNDLIQEGKSRDIWGQMGGNAGWFEFHHVEGSLAIQAVTRRTDKIIAAARKVALSNVATLEERVSQHLSETDTVTGNHLFITMGRIEGRVYGVTKDKETFEIYVRMMWNFRYGENSANGVITQYAQFRSERQGARQAGKPVVTERQATAEAAKAERQAAKDARRASQLEKLKKAPARLAKGARKDIKFWGETHPDAPMWGWVAKAAEALTETEVEVLFEKGFRTSGDIQSYFEKEFTRNKVSC